MAWERFLRVCRVIFFLSVGALSVGFVLVLVIVFGDAAWLGSPAIAETAGKVLFGGGVIGGGISVIFLRLSGTKTA